MNIEELEGNLGFNPKGSFFGNLNRKNAEIREDRAIAIAEAAERTFKREIEDMLEEKKNLMRSREAMLDLSPTSADSLVLASDFDPKAFYKKDLEIGVRLREISIKIEIAVDRFNELFADNKTETEAGEEVTS